MRNIYKYLLIAVAIAAVGLASCMYDDGIDNVRIVEGRPAQVELTFAVENNVEVTTRAAQDEMYEHLVQNIYVFVFNGNQRVIPTKSFFDSEVPNDITNYENKGVGRYTGQSHGTVTFGALSGSGLKVCAIANVNISNTNVTRADIGEGTSVDLKTLDNIKTYSELQEMSIRLTSGNIERTASFMMTGETTVNLQAEGTTTVTIPLKRADSKITFNVTAQAPANSGYKEFTFIPNSFRVVNAPLKSYILPRVTEGGTILNADMDATKQAEDFYSVPEDQALKFEKVGNNSGSFTFYMYENLKKPEKLIEDNNYALREKENKGDDGRNIDYIYAPKYATHVVLTGELSYSFDEKYTDPLSNTESTITKWLVADVEYVVHLGHNSADDVNDYSTLRNHHYTYNVTIKGVNDLIVEVDNDNNPNTANQDNEQRPGAEGEIVMSTKQVINVDGHYDRANIQLTDTEAKELHFAVNTPWESGYDTNGFNVAHNSTLRDYKWVKFLINKEVSVAQNATTFAAYPGDKCYDGGKTPTGTAVQSTAYNRTVTLRDIRQLSNYLRVDANREAAMSTDGMIYITVFIDEYLYFYNPIADPMNDIKNTNYKGVSDITDAKDAGLLLWKKSVNQPDRMLHIVKAGDMKYSDDYETSISRSVVTIKQRAIQTFYNVGAENLKSAWGTETINETPRMTPAGVEITNANTYKSYNDYVRAQMLTSNGTPNWRDVISSTQQYGFGRNYSDPIYACAMRNRDFDGSGKIEQQEVQWYLTSLNQMGDLWVGEPCMPSYARLFHLDDETGYDGTYFHKGNNATLKGRHYITSYWVKTATTGGGGGGWYPGFGPGSGSSSDPVTSNDLYVYWAEEYGANCAFNTSLGEWYGSPQSGGKNVVSVRCVRNLGMAYTSTQMPTDYLQVVDSTPNNATDNEVSVDLSYMNIAALRQTFAGTGHLAYVDMNEIGENNRPYFGFNVLPKTYENTTWYAAYQGEQVGGSPVCPDGYRIPTQREMLIMVKALPKASWTSTGYLMYNGLTTQVGKFGTFHYNYSRNEINMTTNSDMVSSTDAAVTRCVKDNPNAKHSSSSDYGEGGEGW